MSKLIDFEELSDRTKLIEHRFWRPTSLQGMYLVISSCLSLNLPALDLLIQSINFAVKNSQ